MLLISLPAMLLIADICSATSLSPVFSTDDSACQSATGPAHDPSCWVALGYNAWFDTWKRPCLRLFGCNCESRQPWSDCALEQYHNATDSPTKSKISCVDLKQPELCQIPIRDWPKLSKKQLATAYVSFSVGSKPILDEILHKLGNAKQKVNVLLDLYHFVHDWYAAIANGTAQAAILSTLSDQISNPFEGGINRTFINTTAFLTSLMTTYGTNKGIVQNFTSVLTEVTGEKATINVATTDIMIFQNFLCQMLVDTLTAILCDWSTPYFDTLSKNGALLGIQPENIIQFNQSLGHTPPPGFVAKIPQSSFLSNDSTSRALLSADVTQTHNFFIHECDADSPGGLASQLSSLLDTFHMNLFHVMKETTKGPHSRLGYNEIFKTPKWIPIRRFYEHMFHAVGTRGNPAANQAIPDNRPVFICLQPHNPATKAAYAVCEAEPRLRAFQQPGAPYAIGLCPAFWALPMAPVRAFCPHKGEVSEDYTGNALQLNQQSFIVHQLIRLYLGAEILVPERYTLNEVLGLDADDAYRNPSSWSYWFASVVGCTSESWDDLEL